MSRKKKEYSFETLETIFNFLTTGKSTTNVVDYLKGEDIKIARATISNLAKEKLKFVYNRSNDTWTATDNNILEKLRQSKNEKQTSTQKAEKPSSMTHTKSEVSNSKQESVENMNNNLLNEINGLREDISSILSEIDALRADIKDIKSILVVNNPVQIVKQTKEDFLNILSDDKKPVTINMNKVLIDKVNKYVEKKYNIKKNLSKAVNLALFDVTISDDSK